jgi:hypothetical protein
VTPNAFDAAFAAAMLGNRIENATLNTLTRVSIAALAIAELEAEDAIPEGDYESLLDRVGQCLREPSWPQPGIRMGAAVREVLAGMEAQP